MVGWLVESECLGVEGWVWSSIKCVRLILHFDSTRWTQAQVLVVPISRTFSLAWHAKTLRPFYPGVVISLWAIISKLHLWTLWTEVYGMMQWGRMDSELIIKALDPREKSGFAAKKLGAIVYLFVCPRWWLWTKVSTWSLMCFLTLNTEVCFVYPLRLDILLKRARHFITDEQDVWYDNTFNVIVQIIKSLIGFCR